MASTYSSLLRIELIANGEQSGTWGTTTNTNLGTLIEQSIAGTASLDVTAGNVTLTTNDGSSDQARCMILNVSGTPGTSRNIVAPSSSKVYVVINGSDSSVVVKGSATTGVTIPAGLEAIVAWNGSDFVQITATGDLVGPGSSTDNAVTRFDGTTGKLVQNSGVTIDDSNVVTASGFAGPLNGTVGATTPTTGVFTQVDITAQGDLRLQDSAGGEYVAIQAPTTLAASYTLTMPTTDGDASQVLTTDGSGALSWTTPSSGITTGKSIAMAMIFGF